ncbi:HEAT repeat domain-containing protein [Desulfosoma caldarium]|uniref:HEAT repeat protein n=1 Tax=Desulfosoma caldarium TaxID=610254 RepID=A0A3N1UUC0_9BACT|nr:HEAT repeat domain-containing protein [Desulfosoma caldarium]ROQ92320.1 HEAT repeat protein [Desulfosoma caldarium]
MTEKLPSPSSGSAEPTPSPWQPVYDIFQGVSRETVCARYGLREQDLDKLITDYKISRRQMALADEFIVRKVGRNDPCPCGSGKKYKKCCMALHDEARKTLPKEELHKLEKRLQQREKLQEDITKGFQALMKESYGKARKLAEQRLEKFPEDDRLHDIVVAACLGQGDYDAAFYRARTRYQVAVEEKDFFQENGYHKREGLERAQLVHFYSPSTWLEKLWIAQRARAYAKEFPTDDNNRLRQRVFRLKVANDLRRFPQKDTTGFEVRRTALAAVVEEIHKEGPAAVPYLLPLCYNFSWASLFVPELIHTSGHEASARLLAELSMFRFPYFSQMCLKYLEEIGEAAVAVIEKTLMENTAFDELKTGLLMVLGAVHTEESFQILARMTEHQSPYVVNWAAQALGRQKNPAALPYLEKAKARLGELSKIQGAIQDLVQNMERGSV